VIATKIAAPWVKYFIIVILIIYMYGAICLKYVSGAESMVAGISYTFWDNDNGFKDAIGFDPYYLGLIVFGTFSIYFSFGNIENSKWLQIITTILRFIVTAMMTLSSVYYLGKDGANEAKVINWKSQLPYLAEVFGNTTFVFIYHHSISGIVYPVRPQKDIKKMFLYSNIIGALFLFSEAFLAYFAFSGLSNLCVNEHNDPDFRQ